MPFVILPTNSASGGYNITNSLRFNGASLDYLNRTPASSGNRKTFTISYWFKRSKLGATEYLLGATSDAWNLNWLLLYFDTSDKMNIQGYTSSGSQFNYTSTQVFRDVSAWYHLIVAIDTTQATASNRVKIYINGSQMTSFSSSADPTQNIDTFWNSSNPHYIGQGSGSSYYTNGYVSEFHSIDGQQLTPTSFGETDEDTGIWKPKAYTGTYGTNGFYLQFKNSASLGTDSSGNGNNFTVNNLTSIDQTTDTPTNNFCTLNPLNPYSGTLSEGNLKKEQSSYDINARGTFGLTAGKWYWEVKMSTTHGEFGVCEQNKAGQSDPQGNFPFYFVYSNGSSGLVVWNNATSGGNLTVNSGYTNFSANAICMIAYDADNGRLYAGLNGTWYNSAVPASGTGFLISGITPQFSGTIVPFFGSGDTASRNDQINFGNPIYSANSYTDGAGYGNFSYSVPSGFFSLCTKNLSVYG